MNSYEKSTLAKQKLLFYGNSHHLCSKTIKLALRKRWNMCTSSIKGLGNSLQLSWCSTWLKAVKTLTSLFHMKITESVTKSLHQDFGPCYLHWPIFSYTYILLFRYKICNCCDYCFLHQIRLLFNYIYYKTLLVWGLVSIWLTSAINCP